MGNQCACGKKDSGDYLFKSSSRRQSKHSRSDAGIKSSISYENAPFSKSSSRVRSSSKESASTMRKSKSN